MKSMAYIILEIFYLNDSYKKTKVTLNNNRLFKTSFIKTYDAVCDILVKK